MFPEHCTHIKELNDVRNLVYCCNDCASKIFEVQPASVQQLKAEIVRLKIKELSNSDQYSIGWNRAIDKVIAQIGQL